LDVLDTSPIVSENKDKEDPMDWQLQLVHLYEYVCQQFSRALWSSTQRFSNNATPVFTDEEVITISLFGVLRGHRQVRAIYDDTGDHLAEWVPGLPGYEGYGHRLNRCWCAFSGLIESLLEQMPQEGLLTRCRITDSLPIVLANGNRSGKAKVAGELADKGYCSSKAMWYYGVKLHLLTIARAFTLPIPEAIGLSAGSANDLTILRSILPTLHDTDLYGDTSYADQGLIAQLANEQNVHLHTPVKKAKGQERLPLWDHVLSTHVSRMRQPIESLFNWIEEKTGIQTASKVRSYNGLLVHVFGKLAAAMFLLAFYF
jgi:hypothetical protein